MLAFHSNICCRNDFTCSVPEIVCLNLELDGVNLVATIRKPFDVLAKGLNLEGSTP